MLHRPRAAVRVVLYVAMGAVLVAPFVAVGFGKWTMREALIQAGSVTVALIFGRPLASRILKWLA